MSEPLLYETITSRQNPTLVELAKLKDQKARRESGLYLAEGVKLTEEAVAAAQKGNVEIAFALLTREALEADGEALQLAREAKRSGARLVVLPAETFEKVSTEAAPQGVLVVLKQNASMHRAVSKGQEASLPGLVAGKRIVFLSEVRDPGNLGTILRSAAAFGSDGVILSDCADHYHPRTVRASMGALFRLPTVTAEDGVAALRSLRDSGRRVLGAALRDDSAVLGSFAVKPDDVPVIGNEGHGLSDEMLRACSGTLLIPMTPGTESLNAAIAASVILWEYFRTY